MTVLIEGSHIPGPGLAMRVTDRQGRREIVLVERPRCTPFDDTILVTYPEGNLTYRRKLGRVVAAVGGAAPRMEFQY